MKRKVTYLLFIFILASGAVYSQGATLRPVGSLADTVDIESVLPANAPRKAFLYSALLPGMGQIYNRMYWKVPIVYGGFIGLGYMVTYYDKRYVIFREELFDVLEDPTYIPPSGASESQLRTLITRARRERDYMIVISTFYYILQIVDAHVDAHLREFDLNPDLQLEFRPSAQPTATGSAIGAGIVLKFRP